MRRSRAIFILISLILLPLVIYLGCSNPDEPPVVINSGSRILVHYINPADAPVIDGHPDAIWDAATETLIPAGKDLAYGNAGRIVLLRARALCDSTYLYFAAAWKDTTRNNRYKPWAWGKPSGQKWRQDISIQEDNLGMFFTRLATDSVGADCAKLCHAQAQAMVNETGQPVDGWEWRAGLLDSLHLADDLLFSDSLDLDESTGVDAEIKTAYLFNLADDSVGPKYIEKDSLLLYKGWTLLADDTVRLDPATHVLDEHDTITVPAYILCMDYAGSRWDVESKGYYDPVTRQWSVEFKRLLNTSHDDDVRFIVGDSVVMTIGISDHAKGRHMGVPPVRLIF